MAEAQPIEGRTRRNHARLRRDRVIMDIEKAAAQQAVAAVRDEYRTILYDAQAEALKREREPGILP